jgi:DNA-binding LacI/PurR family transcriptional regulator
MAGVSTATVSRVLSRSGRVSPELEALVRNAAKTLNYQPTARARLRARRARRSGC